MKKKSNIKPGTVFKMRHTERDGAEHVVSKRTYTVVKEYPHFVLAEYIVNGNRLKECFTRKEIEAGTR